MAQDGTHHQDFIFEAIYKEGANRPINQARSQSFFFRWARFALEKSAGDFTRCVIFFLVMHGQREEILPRLLRFGEGHIGHHGGFAERGNHSAIGLTGHFARFECQAFFAPFD